MLTVHSCICISTYQLICFQQSCSYYQSHYFTAVSQHGQRLKVMWRTGRPAGVAFLQMATPEDARAVLMKLPRTGPLRNMLPLGALGKVFVSLGRASDRYAAASFWTESTL